ncbi:MAG: DUF5615 family PIN-like protein [Verrucomicrobiales bacterium]|nr:DUF5615 family PIN-like protein [Verrucomicrobiales bacterium]HQW28153.1 DUF5615 family PIN-like protein [Verrucomicrobiales bacterium]
MRLLIDENLPATLADLFPVESYHATRFGRNPSDQELWKAAREQDLVILTRDTDFFDRLMIEGPPPKVVWVRLGNLRRRELEMVLVEMWPRIEGLLENADLIEIHPRVIETFQHPGS